jgi:uncharacterized iron-regulated membrane protein
VFERVRADAPQISMQLTPPANADGVWRAENFDRTQPTLRYIRVLNAYSGAMLFMSNWAQLTPLAQATAVGIQFHRGELGLWNQALLALTALTVIFSVASGLMMWWLRRPRGRMSSPRLELTDLKRQPLWLWPTAAALAWTLPMLGCSLIVLMLIEGLRFALQSFASRCEPGLSEN